MGKSKSKTKSSGTSTTNQTQTNTPWAPAATGLTNLANMTNQAMLEAQAVPQYTGDFLALPGMLQQQVPGLYTSASQLAGSLVDPALAASQQALSQLPTFADSPTLDQGTRTFGSYDASQVAPVVQAAMAPYIRQLQEQILPGLQSAGIESGAYSNDRAFAVMPQQALRDTSLAAAEIGAGIGFQDFLAQQQRLQNAYQMSTQRGLGEADVLTQRLGMYPELLDTAMRMSSGSADLASQAASYDTAMRQAEIQNALMRDAYNVQAPYRGLDMAANIFSTFSPYATQQMNGTSQYSNKSTTTQSQPLAGQILQGALGIGSMLAGFPGLGTALGIGAGSVVNPLINMGGGTANWFQQNPFGGNLFGTGG